MIPLKGIGATDWIWTNTPSKMITQRLAIFCLTVRLTVAWLVLVMRFELTWYCYRGIFLLLTFMISCATFLCCSLEHVFTIAKALGGRSMLSTHLSKPNVLNLARRSHQYFAVLAYSIYKISPIKLPNICKIFAPIKGWWKKSLVSADSTTLTYLWRI